MAQAVRVALAATVLLTFAIGPAGAQRSRPSAGDQRRPAIAVLGGPSPYDLSGTGTGGFGALRLEVPSGRVLVFEPGLAVFRYRSQADESITYLLPEFSAQVQVPAGPVRPYLGGGVGFTEFLSGRGQSKVTLHGAAGLRIAIAGGWGLRGEARLRSIDPFHGNTFDLGVGLAKALGG
jgi:hypothetical protein